MRGADAAATPVRSGAAAATHAETMRIGTPSNGLEAQAGRPLLYEMRLFIVHIVVNKKRSKIPHCHCAENCRKSRGLLAKSLSQAKMQTPTISTIQNPSVCLLLKDIGSLDEYFLKVYKITSVISIHRPSFFNFLVAFLKKLLNTKILLASI